MELVQQKSSLIKYIRKNAPYVIQQRGKEIYKKNSFISIDICEDKNTAEFKLQGTVGVYTINILGLQQITNTQCTCPYDWDGICKHQVAAILHLENRFGIKSDSQNVIKKTPKVIKLELKKRKSSEPFDIPYSGELTFNQITIFKRYHKNFYYYNFHRLIHFKSIKKNTITFDCYRELSMSSSSLCQVKYTVYNEKLTTACSCNIEVHSLCIHQFAILYFIFNDLHSPTFFNELIPENLELKKKELADEYGLNLETIDKYFELKLLKNKLIFEPTAIGNGIQKMDLHKNNGSLKLLNKCFDNTNREKHQILDLGLKDNSAIANGEIGYVFEFESTPHYNRYHSQGYETGASNNSVTKKSQTIKVIPIYGKPDKSNTKLSTNIREMHELTYDTMLHITPNDQKIFEMCSLFQESEIDKHLKISGYQQYPSIQIDANDLIQGYYLEKLQRLIPLLENKNFIYHTNKKGWGTIRRMDIKPFKVSSKFPTIEFVLKEDKELITLSIVCNLDGELYPVLLSDNQPHHFLFVNINDTNHLVKNISDALLLSNFYQNPEIKIVKSAFDEFFNTIIKPISLKHKIHFKNIKNMNTKHIQMTPEKKQLYVSELGKFVIFRPVIKYSHEQQAEPLVQNNLLIKNENELISYERDSKYEEEYINQFKELHPKFIEQHFSEFYHLSIDEMVMNEWFFNTYDKLSKSGVEIFGWNQLKNFGYSPHKAKINVNVKSGEDWFEVDVDIAFGNEKITLAEVRKALIKGDRFIKLGDGSLGILPKEWLEKFTDYFRHGELEGNTLKVSNRRISIVDKLFENIDDDKILKEIALKKEKISRFKEIKNIKTPKNIHATLRDYQKEGINWLNFLDEFKWGGILADDMGLGKTLQMLTFLQMQVTKSKKANLVILPTSLIFNWENEIKKFCPNLKAHFYYGNQRVKTHNDFKNHDVILTTYGVLANDIKVLEKYKFNYAILDESQAIKNPLSKRYKAACLLRSENKLTLTGTPIENNTFDLYAQMNFVNPGFLGNQNSFKENYSNPIDRDRNTDRANELQKMIYPFVLRRTKEQVAKELPAKTEGIIYCTMKEDQRKVYDAFRNKYRNYILKKIDENGLAKSKLYVLDGLLKLRQICDTPELIPGEESYGNESIKLKELIRHITEKTSNHKILVFSQFVKMLTVIKRELSSLNINFEYLDGQNDKKQRKASVENFQQNEQCRVFLISLKAGGLGLNLTAADYVFIVDPWWNPAVENQAIDRCHRIGQDKKVFAYRMICKDTVEEKIINYQLKKKQIASELIHTEDSFIKQLNKNDIMEIFG